MNQKTPFLGTGWSFPPEFIRGQKSVKMISDEEDVRSSLEILFSTAIGERIMQPTYGCDLKKLLFEPLDTALKAYIADLLETAILYHEPRIRLDGVDLVSVPAEGRIDIYLDYTIRATNSRYNFVFPFYMREGTDIDR
jgi:phage baseplate assembly protein W